MTKVRNSIFGGSMYCGTTLLRRDKVRQLLLNQLIDSLFKKRLISLNYWILKNLLMYCVNMLNFSYIVKILGMQLNTGSWKIFIVLFYDSSTIQGRNNCLNEYYVKLMLTLKQKSTHKKLN